jgi:hypothetical protein
MSESFFPKRQFVPNKLKEEDCFIVGPEAITSSKQIAQLAATDLLTGKVIFTNMIFFEF